MYHTSTKNDSESVIKIVTLSTLHVIPYVFKYDQCLREESNIFVN